MAELAEPRAVPLSLAEGSVARKRHCAWSGGPTGVIIGHPSESGEGSEVTYRDCYSSNIILDSLFFPSDEILSM